MYMTLDKGNLSKIPIAIYYGLIPSGRQRVNLFAAACDQAGMKISTKMTKLLICLIKPKPDAATKQ